MLNDLQTCIIFECLYNMEFEVNDSDDFHSISRYVWLTDTLTLAVEDN